MELVLALVGLLGGLLLSALFWWVMTHRVVPGLEFSTAISKRPHVRPNAVVYRIKVKNASRRRGVIDINFRARLVLRGHSLLEPGIAGTTSIIDVPLDVDHLFRLAPRGDRILWLEFGPRFADDWRPYLPAEVCDLAATSSDGCLEALLRLSEEASFRVQALAYDEFSGARKFYESKCYVLADIVTGRFTGLTVTPLDPDPEQSDASGVPSTMGTAADRTD